MKTIAAIFFLSLMACHRPPQKTVLQPGCYKARLEIKGICMNYVIKVLEGDATKLQLAKTWLDESTGKTHENVFALGSSCSFPDMEEGAEFYFTIATKADENCNVCMAYRPVPQARHAIVVHKNACP